MSKIKMEKIKYVKSVDNYSVFDKSGKKICDTSTIEDAILMVSFGENRSYRKNKILLDQVVNVSSIRMEDDKQLKSQNILPERMAVPFCP